MAVCTEKMLGQRVVDDRNPNLWETKKNRENTRQIKQSHTQDNIYVVQQFAYVHGVVGISL